MTIAVGDTIPAVELKTMVDGAPAAVQSAEILGTGRVVLFGVPGAFTPGCSKQHLPGFVNQAASISAKGVDKIACIAVNDVFVMDAWGASQNVGDSIVMLADGNGDFAKALGLDVDGSAFGLGLRSSRYAMVIEDGVVTAFMPEDGGFKIESSTAECVLNAL